MSNNFTITNQNITLVKGDTLSFAVKAYDQYGDLVTFDEALFTCKKDASSLIPDFELKLDDGISFDTDHYVVRTAPTDTLYLDPGLYFYDMKVKVGEDVFTIMKGVIDLEQNISDLEVGS